MHYDIYCKLINFQGRPGWPGGKNYGGMHVYNYRRMHACLPPQSLPRSKPACQQFVHGAGFQSRSQIHVCNVCMHMDLTMVSILLLCAVCSISQLELSLIASPHYATARFQNRDLSGIAICREELIVESLGTRLKNWHNTGNQERTLRCPLYWRAERFPVWPTTVQSCERSSQLTPAWTGRMQWLWGCYSTAAEITVYVKNFTGILFREIMRRLAQRNFPEYVACLVLRLVTNSLSWGLFRECRLTCEIREN